MEEKIGNIEMIGTVEIKINKEENVEEIMVEMIKTKMDSLAKKVSSALLDIIIKGVGDGAFVLREDKEKITLIIKFKDGKLKVEELSSYPYPPPLNSF
jgi:hypothetical protein